MRFSEKIILGLIICAISFSAAVFTADADGMLIPPPSRRMFETEQKAVIFYDGGVENLILSITFQGDAGDFAWIIPTPSKPEVEKSVDSLFMRLDELTRPEYLQPLPLREGALNMLGEDAAKSVTVLETKKIDYYDISVLEADDSQALYNWLNDHGYRFAQAGTHIVDEYIQKGWVFTAVKIDNDLEALAQGQMNTGHGVPLSLKFATEQIVYPLKISSLNGLADDAPEGQITYIESVDSKAAQLDSDRILATDRIVKDHSAANGKINFNLKKRADDPVHKIVSIKSVNSTGEEYDSVLVTNNRKNVFQFVINEGFSEQFQIDLGSDFKQNQWQKFEFSWQLNASANGYDVAFSIDGIERTMNKIISSKNNIRKGSDLARVVLGGNYIEAYASGGPENGRELSEPDMIARPGIYIDRSADLLVDSLEIISNQQVIFKANFDGNLDVILSGGETNTMRVFGESGAYQIMPAVQNSMGVLLYVFADKKYDITGFDLQYAGWMEKEDVENIAKIDGKTPWIVPEKDRYFLTRHYRYMAPAEMTDDLYPIESSDQSSYNFAGSDNAKIVWVLVLITLSTVSLGVMAWFVLRKERK